MSKPIARVTFFVLISLVLIAATSVGLRGLLADTSASAAESDAAAVQSHSVGGLQTNLNHDRSSVTELESQQLQSQDQPGTGHGCESEAQNNPNDF
jgi:hypothetical protein